MSENGCHNYVGKNIIFKICFLDCLLKSSSPHKGSLEEHRQEGELLGYTWSHHASYQPITGPSTKLSGAQEHNHKWEPKLKTQRKGDSAQDTPRAVPGEPQAHRPDVTISQGEQLSIVIQNESKSVHRGFAICYGMEEKSVWEYIRFTMECLEEETKGGKGIKGPL